MWGVTLAKRSGAARGRTVKHPAAGFMLIRQLHSYLSVFVAPMVLFFAATGSLQLFSLHEAHGDYRPPALIEKLGTLHKDQKFALGSKHKPTTPQRVAVAKPEGDWVAPAAKPAPEAAERTPRRAMALKWLFLAAAVALMVSTLLGLWMALTQNRQKAVLLLLLLAGMAAPVAILIWL